MTALQTYLDLAPTHLRNRRENRYDGGGFDISLGALDPEDVSLIIRIYRSVKGIYDLWLYMRDAPNYDLPAVPLSHPRRPLAPPLTPIANRRRCCAAPFTTFAAAD